MKKIILFLAMILTANYVQAAFVGENTAREIAEKWFANRSPLEAKGRKIVKSFVSKNQDLPVFYTYGFENGGFVIVSAEDAADPIIGYSYTSPITEKIDHPAVKSWFDNYSHQISEISSKKADNSKTLPKWEAILKNDFKGYKNGKAVEPLVKSTWDQGSPYDMYVPVKPGTNTKAAVGCVATAMAQVMNYYQWPITGQGSNGYTPDLTGQYISANFGNTTYEWAKTPDGKLLANHPAGAKHAVALLSYHCGIAVNMMYDIPANGGSGAYSQTALAVLKSNFKYKTSASQKYRSSYSATWDNLLKAELDLKRPLYYSGSGTGGGHAFVCDGYQEADNKFHFNWGWNGSYDGYFASNALNPEGVGTGGGDGGFNSSQAAFFGLWDYSDKPEKVTGIQVQDIGTGTQLKLSWNKSSSAGVVKYKVYAGTENSYTYNASYTSTDTVFTISNLAPGVLHYLAVTALDAQNDESKIVETTYTPLLAPATPVQAVAVPEWQNVKIVWSPNSELDLAGYNIYRSTDNNAFVKVNTELITDTHYVVSNPAHDSYSYYKVAAVDLGNNESVHSASIAARPVTLDQGVLVVDESINGSGTATSPDDAMQDAFYQSITRDVTHRSNFDATAAGKVTLSDLGAYSSVIWHNQSVELSSIFNANQAEIKKYLDFGGKMLISADKPGKLIESSNSYPYNYQDESIAQTYFGIDSAFYKAAGRCNGALPFTSEYNALTVDTAKTTVTNGEHIKKLETLRAAAGANYIYTYNSNYDISNAYGTEKGKPLGLEKLTNGYKTVTLAVPLYFVAENDARTFINHVLGSKFGESVTGISSTSATVNDLVLYQNYPNPFNPTTTISFNNPQAGLVNLSVYNVKGELVKELISGHASAGIQKVAFDAMGLNSGMYFYKVSAAGKNQIGKMMLIK